MINGYTFLLIPVFMALLLFGPMIFMIITMFLKENTFLLEDKDDSKNRLRYIKTIILTCQTPEQVEMAAAWGVKVTDGIYDRIDIKELAMGKLEYMKMRDSQTETASSDQVS